MTDDKLYKICMVAEYNLGKIYKIVWLAMLTCWILQVFFERKLEKNKFSIDKQSEHDIIVHKALLIGVWLLTKSLLLDQMGDRP